MSASLILEDTAKKNIERLKKILELNNIDSFVILNEMKCSEESF